MTRETFYNILQSILIGACVAFLSSLFDGVIDLLQGYGNNVVGGVASSIAYKARRA